MRRRRIWLSCGLTLIACILFPSLFADPPARTHTSERCPPHLIGVSIWRERARLSHAIDAQKIRTDGDLTLWQTSRGPVWTPPRAWGEHVARTFHVPETGRWTHIDGSPSLSPVRKGDIVIDGGAHVGDSPRHALLMGAAMVVAVEPDPDNLRALRRNLAREIASGRVTVVPKGVYDREGVLTFVRNKNSWDGEFHPEVHDQVQTGANERVPAGADRKASSGSAPNRFSLPVTTIDRLVAELKLPRVDLIKLDIEGSEVPALRGAIETIRRFKPRMAVAAYHKPGDFEDVQRIVREARTDYEITPSRCLPYEGRLFPNLLYFHD